MIQFEISYPGGMTHEVEIPGIRAVLGRDPGCDIVLNDSRCSRRHAVVEEGRGGLVVRDTGSANGVYVNGRRVDESPLETGDVIRLGEVKLKLLGRVAETVVMAPEDFDLRTAPGAPRPPELDPSPGPPPMPTPRFNDRPSPPRAAAESRPAAERRPAGDPRLAADTRPVDPRPRPGARRARPATVSLLVALWTLFVPVSAGACLFAAHRLGGGAAAWTAAGVASLVLAALGAIMAVGLRALAPWARHLQVATAAFGLLICPFTLASATLLLYLARPEVKAAFERAPVPEGRDGTGEATFALSVLGMLLLGLALTAAAVLVL